MSDAIVTSAPDRPRRGVFGILFGVSLVRIFIMAVVLIAGEGVMAAFHFEYAAGHLPFAYSGWIDLGVTAVLGAALIGVYALLVRVFEARWPSEAKPGLGWAAFGVIIGAGLFGSVYAILTAMGAAHYAGFNGTAGLATAAAMSLMAGISEELVFRGVLFRILEQSLGTMLALSISAALFGLIHGFNPGATIVSTLAIMFEAGLLLAAAYAWSRSLWLVIGLHFAWNFTEGGVFSAAVSGGDAKGALAYPLSPAAGDLITGGKFGPEASVVAVSVCFALAVVFMIATIRAGKWEPLRFKLVLSRP
jgi:membrane protease YdiL (CAAX protease family)